jgi:hypothetical protein
LRATVSIRWSGLRPLAKSSSNGNKDKGFALVRAKYTPLGKLDLTFVLIANYALVNAIEVVEE